MPDDIMFNSDNATPHLASVYDKQVQITLPYYNEFHDETLNLLKAMRLDPKRWLDTGCGTGTLIEKALKQFPSTQFVLVDPSSHMLREAKTKLKNRSNVNFLNTAVTQDLCGAEVFDVVTAIQSHHYSQVNEHSKATKVCFNLLTTEGVYVTFENIRPLTEKGTEIGKENWKQHQIKSGRDIKTAEVHMQRFGVEYHPLTVEEHLVLLRKTGFSVVELLWFSVMQAGFYCIK